MQAMLLYIIYIQGICSYSLKLDGLTILTDAKSVVALYLYLLKGTGFDTN